MIKLALRSFASVVILFLLFSCENEYSEVGTDLINSIEAQPPYVSENIITYSEKHNSIRSNGYRNQFLGSYDDPFYGMSEAKILTQVSLSQTNPNFGTDPIIDSVVMTLPFYSRQVEQDEYELDSIYGEGSFKVNIYESNQFLRPLDPGEDGDFQENQLYYTDQLGEFSPNIQSEPFVTSPVIRPSDQTSPVVLYERNAQGEQDTLSLSPRLRMKLPNDYFQQKIINQTGTEVLSSNTSFRNYLRGFLIEAEQQEANDGKFNMSMFNLQNEDALITIYYKNLVEGDADDPDAEPEYEYSEYNLNFGGIKLNLYDNEFNEDLTNQNTEEGEENIYLKGGEGSSGVIELFTGPDEDGNGVSDELDELRQKNWLINEASIDLYINDDIASSPKNRINRVFLYNIDDEQVLEDFLRDPTASESNPGISRIVHLGPLDEDENGDPFYRIRLTSHINNIINNASPDDDSTNVRLGLFVSSNIEQADLVKSKNSQLGITKNVPRSMMETPRGIVIHGNQSAIESKKIKLKIIYTETN